MFGLKKSGKIDCGKRENAEYKILPLFGFLSQRRENLIFMGSTIEILYLILRKSACKVRTTTCLLTVVKAISRPELNKLERGLNNNGYSYRSYK
jgi:hypothetical protein